MLGKPAVWPFCFTVGLTAFTAELVLSEPLTVYTSTNLAWKPVLPDCKKALLPKSPRNHTRASKSCLQKKHHSNPAEVEPTLHGTSGTGKQGKAGQAKTGAMLWSKWLWLSRHSNYSLLPTGPSDKQFSETWQPSALPFHLVSLFSPSTFLIAM